MIKAATYIQWVQKSCSDKLSAESHVDFMVKYVRVKGSRTLRPRASDLRLHSVYVCTIYATGSVRYRDSYFHKRLFSIQVRAYLQPFLPWFSISDQ